MTLWINFITRFYGLLIPYVLFGNALFAQPVNPYGISPTTALSECTVDQWTGDNGLLSNNLTSVIQASSGFIWITTHNGLMRFDGAALQIFDRTSVPFWTTEAFYDVYEDKHNTLWFAGRGNGIIRFANNKFEQFLPNDRMVPKSSRALLIQDDGTVWAGSDYKGLIHIKDSVATRIEHKLLDNVSILTLAETPDGTIYVGTNGKGLISVRNGEVTTIPLAGQSNLTVYSVKCLENGKTFIGTSEGLYVYENGETSVVELLGKVQVNHIIEDHFGSIWIGTQRGLARINEELGVYEYLQSGKQFAADHITGLFFDMEGSLWISTGKSGLLRMKETAIRNYSERNNLSLDHVRVVHEGPEGNFYFCLDDGEVFVLENGVVRPMKISTGGWTETVRDILVQNDGTMWMASYGGVLKKNGSNERLFTIKDGLSANSVRRILKDSKGDLLFGTRTGGVVRFRNDSVVNVYNRETGLSSDYVLALEEDESGRLLVGTHSGGLNVINPDGSVDVYHIRDDDDGILIFNVHIDSEQNVWLATSDGLYHFSFKEKKFTGIVFQEVVKGESFFDWIEDKIGNVWVSTNIGLLRFLKSDVSDFVNGRASAVSSRIYDDFDGMKNKECTGATRSLLSSSGEVWVPTLGGVSVVNPSRLITNRIIPPVYITQVITDQGDISNPGENVVIEPGNFRLTLHFTAPSLRAPNKVRFKFKLTNVDQDWKELKGKDREVGYTNLSPGTYKFHVIASNNDGVWNEKGATLTITVLPYFYQTAWFYIFLVGGLLIIIYFLYRWRVDAIEHRNEELMKVNTELDRFVYSASHDLRAPLASILGLVRLTKLDESPENRKQYLEMVEKSIHKLDSFIHDIINYSRNSRTQLESVEVNFESVLNEVLQTLEFQDNSRRIRKEVRIKGSGPFYTDRKRLDIVLYNLVTNAIKYHNTNQSDPWITLDVTLSQKNAVIKVIDNGRGIRKDHVDNIFKMFYRADERSSGSGLGLYIARETVEKLKGTLCVESTPNKGSTFIISIPSLHPPVN